MNPELNPEFDEVLLTAYLDDEVTDEERALVERQLRISDTSRELLEELRSIRNRVVQLHTAQPSRSFQQGPWNDEKETVAASKVVLHDRRSGWNWSFQRLASLAALIAIGACVSVLMFGPKRDTMALTDGVKAKVAPALPTENAPQDAPSDSFAFEPAAPIVGSENSPPLAKSRALEAEAKEDATQESLGRAAMPSRVARSAEAGMPTGAAMGMSGREVAAEGGPTGEAVNKLKEVESSAGLSGIAGRSAPLTLSSGGLGGAGGFGNSAPTKPMAKQKTDTFDSLRVEPAPVEAKMLTESAPVNVQALAPPAAAADAMSSPSELYFLLPLIQQQADGDWLAVDSRLEAAAIGYKEDRDLALKETEASSKISSLSARYTFRFRGTMSDKGKASLNGLEIAEKQSAAVAPNELRLGTTQETIDDAANPLVIELQIPAEKWEPGSERLRLLGFDVPIELPQSEYLDFIAIQTPRDSAGQSTTTATKESPLGKDEKQSTSTPWLGMQFRRIERSRNALDSKKASVKGIRSEEDLEGIEPAGRTRIRVRVVK
jgi:hypothetical protein